MMTLWFMRSADRSDAEEKRMKTLLTKTLLALVAAASLLTFTSESADAFWHRRRVMTAYSLPSVPVTVGYAPVVVARPVIVASPVVTAGYAPVTTYMAPATYAVPAPVTTYYAPSPAPVTTYYSPAPVTTYYAPAASAGVVVQRPVIVLP
jgi:hypothetical protein